MTLFMLTLDECGALVMTDTFETDLFRVKPQPRLRLTKAPETGQEMIALATQLRDEQDRSPPNERVAIGGSLELTVLAGGRMESKAIHHLA